MSSLETARGLGLTARLALVDYRVLYSKLVVLTTIAPRVVLQVLFFALLGRYVGGTEGMVFAFVGATAHVAGLATVVKVCVAVGEEKLHGTVMHLRLGRLPMFAVFAARQWVFLAEALCAVVLGIVAVGSLLGEWALTGSLLALLPLYVVVISSASGLGLAAAVLSAGRRVDILLPNLLMMVLLLFCGIVAPVDTLGPFAPLSSVLPITHGLQAIREALDGGPYVGLLGREALVGAGWYLFAWAALHVQSWRSKRAGHDDFF